MPLRSAAPAGAIVLNFGDHAAGLIGTAETDQYLVQHNIIQNLETGRMQAFCEAFCLAAIALDQFAQAGFAAY